MAIDYTRQDRATPPRNLAGNNDTQSVPRGRHSPSNAPSSDTATPSTPYSPTPSRGLRGEAQHPSLLVVNDELTRLRQFWQQDADAVGIQGHEILVAYAAAHPNLAEPLKALFDARTHLEQTFDRRFGARTRLEQTYDPRFARFPNGSFGESGMNPSGWIAAASTLSRRIADAPVPWTAKGRSQVQSEFSDLTRDLASKFLGTVYGVILDARKRMDEEGARTAPRPHRNSATSGVPTTPAPPVGPAQAGSVESITPGLGPLNIYLGTTKATLTFSTRTLDHIEVSRHSELSQVVNNSYIQYLDLRRYEEQDRITDTSNDWLKTGSKICLRYDLLCEDAGRSLIDSIEHRQEFVDPPLPIVVDLDQFGAFLIDSPHGIETAILNLLVALPANQLLIRVFDPEKAGDSANFLYALGDAQEKVIGQSVRTSPRQLDELLQETEEHITFVTQRYLQGEHTSLTEYNKAAGEVAEPYRIIILYDFPAGFSRSGHHDVDQLNRLGRIIQNGPRTGVFTILVSDEPETLSLVPDDKRKGQKVLHQVVSSLPHLYSGETLSDKTLTKLQAAGFGIRLPRTIPAPPANGTAGTVSEGTIDWRFTPAEPPSDAVARELLDAVKRGINSAEDVVVTPARVLELAAQQEKANATTNRVSNPDRTPDLDRPETWWRGNSADEVAAHFGRVGARQTADLILDSAQYTGVLIGGRPGSGKSVLIHAVIMSLGLTYSPAELEMYLVDFKEGVEFKQYAELGMPQTRLVAIEAERDFGLSVLIRAQQEGQRRGALFKSVTGINGENPAKLSEYRESTGHALPRYVVIIDEFQQLFASDDKIAQQAAAVLEDVLRRGRAWGIHVVLASQSLAGMAALGKHVIGLLPVRIALQSNESDSRLILDDENSDAQILSRAGEGIINFSSGQRDANRRFQAALWSAEARGEVLKKLAELAEHDGFNDNTAVFDGHSDAEVGGLSRATLGQPDTDPKRLDLPLGQPLILDAEPYRAQFKRTAGSNLLIVDEHGAGTLAVLLASLTLRGVPVDLIDYETDHDDWSPVVDDLEYVPGVTVERRRGMRALLEEVAKTVDTRHATDSMREPARVLVVAGMARARDFDPNSYDDDDPGKILARILTDGPEVGVHVIIWFDNPGGIRKRLGSNHIDECGLRVIGPMGRDDSTQLIDNSDAATLKSGQVIVADVDRSTSVKIRRFGAPPTGWIAGLRHE